MIKNPKLPKLQIFLFENLYRFHVNVRYIHDKVYSKGGLYKRYTDNPESYFIHRAVFVAYIASLSLYYVTKWIL